MGASQTVLPFKLTAHGGLMLFGEYPRAMGGCGLIGHELPRPGSAAGYSPSVHVLPLVLMLGLRGASVDGSGSNWSTSGAIGRRWPRGCSRSAIREDLHLR